MFLLLLLNSIFVLADECEGKDDGTPCTPDTPSTFPTPDNSVCTKDLCVKGVCDHFDVSGDNNGKDCENWDGNICTGICQFGECTDYKRPRYECISDIECPPNEKCNLLICECESVAPEFPLTGIIVAILLVIVAIFVLRKIKNK